MDVQRSKGKVKTLGMKIDETGVWIGGLFSEKFNVTANEWTPKRVQRRARELKSAERQRKNEWSPGACDCGLYRRGSDLIGGVRGGTTEFTVRDWRVHETETETETERKLHQECRFVRAGQAVHSRALAGQTATSFGRSRRASGCATLCVVAAAPSLLQLFLSHQSGVAVGSKNDYFSLNIMKLEDSKQRINTALYAAEEKDLNCLHGPQLSDLS